MEAQLQQSNAIGSAEQEERVRALTEMLAQKESDVNILLAETGERCLRACALALNAPLWGSAAHAV